MRDFWPAYRFVKSMIRIIRALINLARRPKPIGFSMPPPGAIAWRSPRFQYDVEIYDVEHEESSLNDHINAKAREGWKLHTIHPIERPSYFVYQLTWERLDHEQRANDTLEDDAKANRKVDAGLSGRR